MSSDVTSSLDHEIDPPFCKYCTNEIVGPWNIRREWKDFLLQQGITDNLPTTMSPAELVDKNFQDDHFNTTLRDNAKWTSLNVPKVRKDFEDFFVGQSRRWCKSTVPRKVKNDEGEEVEEQVAVKTYEKSPLYKELKVHARRHFTDSQKQLVALRACAAATPESNQLNGLATIMITLFRLAKDAFAMAVLARHVPFEANCPSKEHAKLRERDAREMLSADDDTVMKSPR